MLPSQSVSRSIQSLICYSPTYSVSQSAYYPHLPCPLFISSFPTLLLLNLISLPGTNIFTQSVSESASHPHCYLPHLPFTSFTYFPSLLILSLLSLPATNIFTDEVVRAQGDAMWNALSQRVRSDYTREYFEATVDRMLYYTNCGVSVQLKKRRCYFLMLSSRAGLTRFLASTFPVQFGAMGIQLSPQYPVILCLQCQVITEGLKGSRNTL